MARGIPDVPLDGETYASVGVSGLPMVLEYDGPTGGYKLVVSTEAGVAINVSGTVEVTGGQLTVVGGSAYGEDTPHTSGNTGTFIMGVRQDALASSVGADGDYAGLQLDYLGRLKSHIDGQAVQITGSTTLADGMANPTTAALGAHLLGYNGATWDRLYMGVSGSLGVDLFTQLDAVNDEITAYITGSTSLNLMGKTITRAVIDVSGSAAGEETLVAAVGGQQIKVLEVMLIGNADVSIFFQSGYTGTALTGPLSLPADGDGFFIETPAQIEAHHFETLSGEALVLDIDANVLLGGWINYYSEA